MHIPYLYILKTSLLDAHKIGESGNWHWTKPGGFYLEGPSHSHLLTEAKSFLWRALPNHIGFLRQITIMQNNMSLETPN